MVNSGLFRKIILPLIRVYWRVVKPNTFGVKCVLVNPNDHNRILLVRHSYGNRHLWNLPGGGYNLKRETAPEAIVREIKEELSLASVIFEILGEYTTDAEGKHDTVTIFLGRCSTDTFILNKEIAGGKWVLIDNLSEFRPIAHVALYGIRLYRQTLELET